MKLNKVLALKRQVKTNAATALNQAQSMVDEIKVAIEQVDELAREYARFVETSDNPYQMKQRTLFYAQLHKVRQEQTTKAQELQRHLQQCQANFTHCRAEEKLLADLIAKRERDHVYKQQKKVTRSQVVQAKSKL